MNTTIDSSGSPNHQQQVWKAAFLQPMGTFILPQAVSVLFTSVFESL